VWQGSAGDRRPYANLVANPYLSGLWKGCSSSKATAAASDEATNFSSAVAFDTTLGLMAHLDTAEVILIKQVE
jgi:hypothetical protein